jgi:DNA-binding NarL/FixJ family response regulator
MINITQKKRPAQVLVVDDHPVVRDGLAAQVANQPDLELCGEAEDVADALLFMTNVRPDVVVIDISLKTGSGLDLIKQIKARWPRMHILVWSMYPENLYAERALRAGAQGYLRKSQATRCVVEAIRTVLAGKLFVSDELAQILAGRIVSGSPLPRSPMETLSDRELEAFSLIGQGLTSERIADLMHISRKTVETYRGRIKEKLNVANATELVQRATHWVMENG